MVSWIIGNIEASTEATSPVFSDINNNFSFPIAKTFWAISTSTIFYKWIILESLTNSITTDFIEDSWIFFWTFIIADHCIIDTSFIFARNWVFAAWTSVSSINFMITVEFFSLNSFIKWLWIFNPINNLAFCGKEHVLESADIFVKFADQLNFLWVNCVISEVKPVVM